MAGLFKIVVRQNIIGGTYNPFISVFGYRSNLAVINEENELSNQFRTQIVPELVKVIPTNRAIDRVEVYNVTNGVGYQDYIYAAPVAGLRAGDIFPDFMAYGFQYNRLAAGKRNGYKRFGPPTETDVNGALPSAAMLIILNALAVKLSSPIKIALIDTWFPEILERKPAGVYPWTSHAIVDVTFKRLTTQNSRKFL